MSGFQCNAEGCEYVGDLQQLVIHANMAHPSKENNILKMLKITQYFDKKRSMKGEDIVGHLKLGTEELRDLNKGVWYGMVDRDQADKDILSGQHSSSINLDQTPTGPKKAKDVIKKKKSPLKRKRLLEKIKKIKKSEEKEKGEPSKKKKKILKKKRNYEDENKEKEVEPSTKKKKIIKKNGKPEPDPDRIKIHGRNRDPIKGNNKEMDCDFSWELDNCERDLEDLVDINPGEKKFMLVREAFKLKKGLTWEKVQTPSIPPPPSWEHFNYFIPLHSLLTPFYGTFFNLCLMSLHLNTFFGLSPKFDHIFKYEGFPK